MHFSSVNSASNIKVNNSTSHNHLQFSYNSICFALLAIWEQILLIMILAQIYKNRIFWKNRVNEKIVGQTSNTCLSHLSRYIYLFIYFKSIKIECLVEKDVHFPYQIVNSNGEYHHRFLLWSSYNNKIISDFYCHHLIKPSKNANNKAATTVYT